MRRSFNTFYARPDAIFCHVCKEQTFQQMENGAAVSAAASVELPSCRAFRFAFQIISGTLSYKKRDYPNHPLRDGCFRYTALGWKRRLVL